MNDTRHPMKVGDLVKIVRAKNAKNVGLFGRIYSIDYDLQSIDVMVATDDGQERVATVYFEGVEPHNILSSVESWDGSEIGLDGNVKSTNPKDGIGLTKAALSVVPLPPMFEMALAMMEGALKYGRHNYREAGIRYSVYFDAMIRHLTLWFEGQERAEDSGVHHLGHVMACCAIALDDILSTEPQGIDDRPPVTYAPDWLAQFNARVAELKARYPNPKPPCTR